jgi:hypothetical protein
MRAFGFVAVVVTAFSVGGCHNEAHDRDQTREHLLGGLRNVCQFYPIANAALELFVTAAINKGVSTIVTAICKVAEEKKPVGRNIGRNITIYVDGKPLTGRFGS